MASLSPTTVPWTWQAVNIYLWTWQWYRSSACNHSSTLGTPGVILDYYAYPICHLCLSVFPNKIQFPAFFILQHFMSGLIQVTSNFFPVQFFFYLFFKICQTFLIRSFIFLLFYKYCWTFLYTIFHARCCGGGGNQHEEFLVSAFWETQGLLRESDRCAKNCTTTVQRVFWKHGTQQ